MTDQLVTNKYRLSPTLKRLARKYQATGIKRYEWSMECAAIQWSMECAAIQRQIKDAVLRQLEREERAEKRGAEAVSQIEREEDLRAKLEASTVRDAVVADHLEKVLAQLAALKAAAREYVAVTERETGCSEGLYGDSRDRLLAMLEGE